MTFEKTIDVLVLGAGASGLMAAVQAGRAGASVVVADGNEKIGRKLYATGNGRCNFTNVYCTGESFNDPQDGFVRQALEQFPAEEARRFFENLGLMTREEQEGRCYPYSGQAASLVHILAREAGRVGVEFILGDAAVECGREEPSDPESAYAENNRGERPDSADGPAQGSRSEQKNGGGAFFVKLASGRQLRSRSLIVACGGKAGPVFGSTGDGYGFAKGFGHTLRPPRPGLVACLSEDPVVNALRGRVRAGVRLYENGRLAASEQGEVQFTGSGLSGICVMDLTRHMEAARPPRKKKKSGRRKEAPAAASPSGVQSAGGKWSEDRASGNGRREEPKEYVIAVDFVPDRSEEELTAFLEQAGAGLTEERSAGTGSKSGAASNERKAESITGAADPANARMAELLRGLLSDHNAEVLAASCETAADAARLLKDFRVRITGTQGWKEAQVTCGGVRREEVEPSRLESVKVPGLFFCGEVLDVDGRCGGYNLQWAWASGMVSGRCAAEAAMKSRNR